jgi:hypothetical protein
MLGLTSRARLTVQGKLVQIKLVDGVLLVRLIRVLHVRLRAVGAVVCGVNCISAESYNLLRSVKLMVPPKERLLAVVHLLQSNHLVEQSFVHKVARSSDLREDTVPAVVDVITDTLVKVVNVVSATFLALEGITYLQADSSIVLRALRY